MEPENQLQEDHEEFNLLSTSLQQKFQTLIFKDEVQDAPFIQALNYIVAFKNLVNDVYSLTQLPTKQLRDILLNQKSYIKYYAEPLYEKEVNSDWFVKTLKIGNECLRQLNEIDLKDKPNVLLIFGKLRAMIMMYPYAITFAKEDIFSFEENSKEWEEIRRFMKKRVLAPKEKIDKEIKRLAKGIQIATAMSYHNVGVTNEFMRTLNILFSAPFYLMNEQHRQHKNVLFKSNIDIGKVKELWNFTEGGVTKYLVKFALPSIAYMKKIFLSGRQYPMLTEKSIISWQKGQTAKLVLEPAPKDQVTTKENLFQPSYERICVRVLSNVNLQRNGDDKEGNDFSTIIFHVHGGGFISLSSRTHQTYSRKWANKCGAPVFSVDYRKAPEFPYPAGLADVWQAYNWLLNQQFICFPISDIFIF